MDWFRVYSDMPFDPKIGTLSDSQFRTWVELLCVAGKVSNGGETDLTTSEASWLLRRNVTDDVTELLQRLLVTKNGKEKLCITKWDERQKKSDNSAARVRKHRESIKRNVTETLPKQECNALEKIRVDKIIKEEPMSPSENHSATESSSRVDYHGIIDAYNKFCPSLPRVRDLTPGRRKSISAMWKKYERNEVGPLPTFDALFKKAEASDFLTGRSGKWCGGCFDWLLKESNAVKVIEGNYDNKTALPGDQEESDDDRRARLIYERTCRDTQRAVQNG